MLQGDYQSVLEAKNEDQFRSVVIRFAQQLGFDKVAASVAVDKVGGAAEFIAVHNAPAAYLQTFEDLSISRRDPVAQHCKRNTVPIIWGQHTYVAANTAELWERQAQFGYGNGIGAPAGLTVLLLTYFSNLSAGLTHYGTTPAPIYFGTGYVKQKTWWTIGLIASILNILIWSTVGVIWWKILGWW